MLTHNDENNNKAHLGIIAQEVEQAIIESGETLDTTDIIFNPSHDDKTKKDEYSVQMTAFIAPMMKAIQELSAQNEALMARVVELEAKLA